MGTLDEKDRNDGGVSASEKAGSETIKDTTHFQKSGRRLYLSDWFSSRCATRGLLPPPWNHPVPGYVVALLAQGGLFAFLQYILKYWSSLHFPAMFPLVVVLLVACGWGMLPAVVAAVWAAILFVMVPVKPNLVFSLTSPTDVISLICFIGVSGALSLLIEQLVRSRIKAEIISNQFEATFEAISDGISIYDQEGKIIRINSAGRDIFAMKKNPKYIGMTIDKRLMMLEMRNEQKELLTPEQWPQARMLRGEVLTGMNAIVQNLDDREVRLSVSGAPIRDEKGQIHGAVCITRDETKRRMLEQRTHEALQALLQMVEELVKLPTQEVQTAGQGVGPVEEAESSVAQRLVELIRSILGCTRVSITAFDPQTQKAISMAVVGISAEQEKQWKARRPAFNLKDQFAGIPVMTRLQASEVIAVDMRQPPWKGRPNPFGVVTGLFVPMNIGGQLLGVLSLDHGGQAHIYTQEERQLAKAVAEMATLVLEREKLFLERAEAQASEISLRETNRLMDEFIAIASHELRTPLTTTKTSVQLAQRNLQRLVRAEQDSYTWEELRQWLQSTRQLLERTEQQINMQNRLIQDLLDVSRIKTNKIDLRLKRLDMRRLVREIVENQRLLEPGRVIVLKNEIGEKAMVQADGERLEQVITNLLSNALKYSEVDRAVEVRMEQEGQNVRVGVRDYGPGLSEEKQGRIWERFYRVPGIKVKSGSGVGLGLGLHISHTLIELHGGKIGVESAPGQGSTFWFTLPLVETGLGAAN